jgi:urease accessory protein
VRRDDAVAFPSTWAAHLALAYTRERGRTLLRGRAHSGPLQVQKSFYPEGGEVCHNVIIHPPGGIAGGDKLSIEVDLGTGAHALITTPGATKWYKALGSFAQQQLHIHAAGGSAIEWLPQENIVFNGACSSLAAKITLTDDAKYFGWEIVCLGRTAAGEAFDAGMFQQRTEVWRDRRLLWIEQSALKGGGALLSSPLGLCGMPVFGTLIAAGCEIDAETLSSCREIDVVSDAQCGVSVLPDLLCARYLGRSTEMARQYFAKLWAILRPALIGRAVCAPRIWET